MGTLLQSIVISLQLHCIAVSQYLTTAEHNKTIIHYRAQGRYDHITEDYLHHRCTTELSL